MFTGQEITKCLDDLVALKVEARRVAKEKLIEMFNNLQAENARLLERIGVLEARVFDLRCDQLQGKINQVRAKMDANDWRKQ